MLAARRHGESDAILTVLTREHGRHLGIVKGGTGRRQRAVVEIGNAVTAHWHARLSEHLGRFQVELSAPHAAMCMADPARLAALSAACATLDAALPEREPHEDVFDDFAALAEQLSRKAVDWPTQFSPLGGAAAVLARFRPRPRAMRGDRRDRGPGLCLAQDRARGDGGGWPAAQGPAVAAARVPDRVTKSARPRRSGRRLALDGILPGPACLCPRAEARCVRKHGHG